MTKSSKADNTLENKVGELVGEATMCWSETPKGVFDSERAAAIVDVLIALFHSYTEAEKKKLAQEVLAVGFNEDCIFCGLKDKRLSKAIGEDTK